jgi:hypothetical protein
LVLEWHTTLFFDPILWLLAFVLSPIPTTAEVTVYTSIPLTGIPPGPAATATCISASACDNLTVNAIPPSPQPLAQAVPVQLLTGGMPGMGHKVSGDFAGFSIELSIANSIREFPCSVDMLFLSLLQLAMTVTYLNRYF